MPRPKLHESLKELGLSNQDAARLLNENGVLIQSKDGPREVTVDDVSRRSAKPAPRAWQEVLGISAASPSPGGGEGDGADGDFRNHESPPQPPPGARIEPPPIVDRAGAEKRIAWAYSFIGTGLAAGAGCDGIAHVWADQAPTLAEAWLNAAAENPWCARVVNAAEAGGPVGELVGMHVYLLGATAYVAGKALPGGDAVFAKYSDRRRIVERVPEPGRNGHDPDAAVAGAQDTVADLSG